MQGRLSDNRFSDGRLSDRDHELMDDFLAEMADALVSGRLSKSAFVEAMAYVMTALDIANREEARFCFKAGVRHFEPYSPEPTEEKAPPTMPTSPPCADALDDAPSAPVASPVC